jgi:hypothetical protein
MTHILLQLRDRELDMTHASHVPFGRINYRKNDYERGGKVDHHFPEKVDTRFPQKISTVSDSLNQFFYRTENTRVIKFSLKRKGDGL